MKDPPRTPRILFVAGSGRSGTTLLGSVLGLADQHCFAGEVKNLWRDGLRDNVICSCGLHFRDCPFWSAVFDVGFGGFDAALVLDFERRLKQAISTVRGGLRGNAKVSVTSAAFRAELASVRNTLAKLYRAIADVSKRPVIVDSSKNAAYLWIIRRLPGVGFETVQLVRDARAVAFSAMRRKIRPEVKGRAALMRVRTPLSAALNWRAKQHEILKVLGRSRVLRLRYEDLSRDPAAALSQLLPAKTAASIISRLEAIAGGAGAPLSHTVSGNPSRFSQQALILVPDEEWRTAMKPWHKGLVTRLTRPLLDLYGYSTR